MGEIRIVGPGETRGYPYPVCKKMLFSYNAMPFKGTQTYHNERIILLTVTSASVAFKSTMNDPTKADSEIVTPILLLLVNTGGKMFRLTLIIRVATAVREANPARLLPSTAYSLN